MMRIGGVVYDWDLWPLRVAAGAGEVALVTYRLTREIAAMQAAIWIAMYPTLRRIHGAL